VNLTVLWPGFQPDSFERENDRIDLGNVASGTTSHVLSIFHGRV
jgi:hypothetical protein